MTDCVWYDIFEHISIPTLTTNQSWGEGNKDGFIFISFNSLSPFARLHLRLSISASPSLRFSYCFYKISHNPTSTSNFCFSRSSTPSLEKLTTGLITTSATPSNSQTPSISHQYQHPHHRKHQHQYHLQHYSHLKAHRAHLAEPHPLSIYSTHISGGSPRSVFHTGCCLSGESDLSFIIQNCFLGAYLTQICRHRSLGRKQRQSYT